MTIPETLFLFILGTTASFFLSVLYREFLHPRLFRKETRRCKHEPAMTAYVSVNHGKAYWVQAGVNPTWTMTPPIYSFQVSDNWGYYRQDKVFLFVAEEGVVLLQCGDCGGWFFGPKQWFSVRNAEIVV